MKLCNPKDDPAQLDRQGMESPLSLAIAVMRLIGSTIEQAVRIYSRVE